MSDKELIIDEEQAEDEQASEAGHGSGDSDTDEYEKVCMVCHRPESKAGKMIELPNHMTNGEYLQYFKQHGFRWLESEYEEDTV